MSTLFREAPIQSENENEVQISNITHHTSHIFTGTYADNQYNRTQVNNTHSDTFLLTIIRSHLHLCND